MGGGLQLNRNISSYNQKARVSSRGVGGVGGQRINSRAPTSLAVCNVGRGGSGQCNLRSY